MQAMSTANKGAGSGRSGGKATPRQQRLTMKRVGQFGKAYFIGTRKVDEKTWRQEYARQARILEVKSRRAKKKFVEQTFGGHLPSCWPMVSDALAVHPFQIKEMREKAEKAGVPTDYTSSGQPIFRDRGHRKRYMQEVEYGVYDRDGGYGDAQKGQSRRDNQGVCTWQEDGLFKL